MRILKNIDIKKSIATKKLQYSKSWGDYLNTILFVITALLGFIICPIFVISFQLDFAHQNDNLSSIIKTKSKLIEWFGYKADFKKDSELSC
jgi:hypothetical protein